MMDQEDDVWLVGTTLNETDDEVELEFVTPEGEKIYGKVKKK